MPQSSFKQGNPTFIDYTPASGAVNAGDVIVLRPAASNTINGITCGVAHQDIANNVAGAIAIGGGIYEVTSLENNANYVPVYWNDSADKVTSVTTNNARFGFIVSGGGQGANTTVRVLHAPNVSPPIT